MPSFFEAIRDLFTTEASVLAKVEAERQRRIAAMSDDPLRATFAARLAKGEYWYDEDIEFNVNPDATHVCEHLRPIEKLIRSAGIPMRMGIPLCISAECLVDPVQLATVNNYPGEVAYQEREWKDRSILDPDIAFIVCQVCPSRIEVVHDDSASDDTPWFPAKPA